MHCSDPGCLKACPAPGAIVQYSNGIVDFDHDKCIGCGYCVKGCPFDIPRISKTDHKSYKCTLCSDRVSVGLEPACVKACPTGAIMFGTKVDMQQQAADRVEDLKERGFANAGLYDPAGVGGTHVMYVMHHADQPELYHGLAKDPHISPLVSIWKGVTKPLAMIGIAPYVLTVYPKLPVKDLQELLAMAKAKPKGLSYSSVGNGSLGHLATELMASIAGVQFNHVPYRSTGQAVLDLSEGRIDITFGLLGSNLPLMRDGKIRALAVTTEKRMPQVPDVPTFAEAGLKGMEASLWFAVVGPAALPAPIVERLNREINAVLGNPRIKARFESLGATTMAVSPAEFTKHVEAETEKWGKVMKFLDLKPN